MLRHAAIWPVLHWACAALVCLVIPGASWLDGHGWLGWTMYASSATYRVRIAAYDERDVLRWISPTEIAARSGRDLQATLAGSEGFRHGPQGLTLRGRLDVVAAGACDLSRSRRVVVTLEERRNLDAPVETTRAERRCSTPDQR